MLAKLNHALYLAGLLMMITAPLHAALPEDKSDMPVAAYPDKANVPTVLDYGATPNDDSDDTAAFQKALSARHSLIHVPPGTYTISDTLKWGKGEKRQVLEGAGPETIIKLKDSCEGFDNPKTPKAMIWTGRNPAQRFRNGIRHLTVDVGKGNPGAIGVQFIANNQGGMTHVTIVDRHGQGHMGLDLGYTDEQGPCLIKDLRVEGFSIGVYLKHAVDSVTMERISLKGQRRVGILNDGQVLNIRQLSSHNDVPTIENNAPGLLTLLDSNVKTLKESSPATAILNNAGLFARNVSNTGYAALLINTKGHKQSPSTTDKIDEFVSHKVLQLFPSATKSLNLPIKDSPTIALESPDAWVSVTAFGPPETVTLNPTMKKLKKRKFSPVTTENWGPALQRAIDSGAKTIYFPKKKGPWGIFGTIHLRKNVERITGLEGSGTYMAPSTHVKSMYPPEFTPTFILGEGTAPAVVVERFDTWYMPFEFVQQSKRTLVVKHLSFHGVYAKPNTGPVFLEDTRAKVVDVKPGATVYARQLNPEGAEDARLLVDGGQMWVLGLKTENDSTVGKVLNGGKLEICGGFIYANKDRLWPKQMFINEGGYLSATVGEWVTKKNAPFNILIDKRGDEERLMKKKTIYGRGQGSLVPLLVSYPEKAMPE